MSRRSSRLVSGGYYNSDEESDSSSVTNISYRENPVKVFKKKSGKKAGSRTSSRANSNASSPAPETPVSTGLSLSPLSSQSESTPRTTPCIPPVATPRPALSQTATHCTSVPPEKSPYTGLCSPSRPELHCRPSHKELSQSAVDSSGYSSSEGTSRKPILATGSTSRASSTSGTPSTGYGSRISSAFTSLIDSASLTAAAVHSKVLDVTALANNSFSSRTKKACGLFLLFLIVLLCIWLLLPLFASFISRMTASKTSSQTQPKSQPVIPASPPPQPSIIYSTPVADPAVVSAAVDKKMQHVLVELQQKQEHLLSQMKKTLQLDVQVIKAKLEAADSDSRLRLEQEVAGLGRQMADYQTDSHSAAASLSLKIQNLEAQNAKLSQELSAIQLMPPPAPCPEPSTAPVINHLTPELLQAMEKWLTDRIKEQDAIRLADKGSCSDCQHPMADKMADFALETQGASVISTRCSETYRIRSACVTLFGFPLWYPSESPRTVIQGYPVLLPGKCWAFHGVQGTLVISLSHPVTITHVTLDHLPRYNSPTGRIDSAPKDFEVYGMKNDTEEGTLLGTFMYDENGESTQTFKLPNPSDVVYRFVELRVLTNWGQVEYTCLYRFRVHGKIAST
ncbi:SUN domain-containing protein 2 [Parambassis ranga]|uniref:SUN domain-containing protein 2-like n=1 Tax=Parambassis ranga TaxID=210632 RepID=A0A6P7J6C5_9TELE|nr:SUN domain-containing protein 2-like [Parambassis ranga]XP_028272176.1 SUN domain-containing protein 2-like [Parambassis ranga]XP_028272185.1 SUN domain-containing protein 2-like [Parambassis ranga]